MEGKRINKQLKLRLSQENIDYIKAKAEKLGYQTVSAFLITCAKEHLVVKVDLSDYQKIANEINYIGKNINSLIRKINAYGFYTATDIETLTMNQEKIIELMQKEYRRLLRKKEKYLQGDLSKQEQKILIEHFTKENLPIPKSILLEEVYDRILKDVTYLCDVLAKAPALKGGGFDSHVWQYVYKGRTLYELEPEQLIRFSDDLFMYTRKIQFKLARLTNEFDLDDWDELRELLDEHEIY